MKLIKIGHQDIDGEEICLGHILETNEAGWIGWVVQYLDKYVIIDNIGGFSSEPEWDKCKIVGKIGMEEHSKWMS